MAVTLVAVVGAMLVAAPMLAIVLCVVAMLGAGGLAGLAARPHERADRLGHRLRAVVVVGALAYLVGLPIFWIGGRQVDALATDSDPSSRLVFFATAMCAFVLGFALASVTGRARR